MSEININLNGDINLSILYDILNEKLNFTYAQPNWDSLIEAVGVLDWLPKGTIVTITVCRGAVFSPDDVTDILLEAYRKNANIHHKSERVLNLRFG